MPFKSDTEDMEFSHPYFIRHKEHLLSKIQRKTPSSTIGPGFISGRIRQNFGLPLTPSFPATNNSLNCTTAHRPITSTDFYKLVEMVKTLNTKQETMGQQMSLLKSENQLLYRELSELRDHHHNQSQIIQTVMLFFYHILFQLFTLLSAFAKESRGTNLQIGQAKRKALPFTSSGSSFANKGFVLNLPAGMKLPSIFSVFVFVFYFLMYMLVVIFSNVNECLSYFKMRNHVTTLVQYESQIKFFQKLGL